jgi:hypothetical protein
MLSFHLFSIFQTDISSSRKCFLKSGTQYEFWKIEFRSFPAGLISALFRKMYISIYQRVQMRQALENMHQHCFIFNEFDPKSKQNYTSERRVKNSFGLKSKIGSQLWKT